jgi:lipoprotein-anchoring transpeptidase ErfK/SrfK
MSIVAVLAVVLAAACGSDGDSRHAAVSAPSSPDHPGQSGGGTAPGPVEPDHSTLRLQRLLGRLGYLPLRIERGHVDWRYPHTPDELRVHWRTGRPNVLVRAAVMAFEADHGQAIDGIAGPHVWAALERGSARRDRAPRPYTFVLVHKGPREWLSVWRQGRFVYRTPANTGIPEAPTPSGIWPIYLRYRSTTMSGTDPSGHHYRDKGVPYVSYFNGGDAIHGFERTSYGTRQSLGCVELPLQPSRLVYRLTGIGTLVVVNS